MKLPSFVRFTFILRKSQQNSILLIAQKCRNPIFFSLRLNTPPTIGILLLLSVKMFAVLYIRTSYIECACIIDTNVIRLINLITSNKGITLNFSFEHKCDEFAFGFNWNKSSVIDFRWQENHFVLLIFFVYYDFKISPSSFSICVHTYVSFFFCCSSKLFEQKYNNNHRNSWKPIF